MAGSITVIGEARDDIAAHLSVRSAAQDNAQAMACAKAARLKLDVTTDTVAVDANFDRACRSVGSLTLTVPRRLTARVEGGTNLRVSAVNALRVTGGGGGAVIQHIPAGVTGELRAGTIEITDVGPLDLTLTAAQATITGVHGAARLTVRAGRCLATDLTGDVDIDERQSEIALDAPRSAVRIAGTGGHVKIGAPQGEVHVDVRLAGISASLTRSTSLTLSTTDGGIDLSLADGLGLDLDATATDGDIIAHDWQLAPVRSDRSAHLAHAWGKTALVSLRVSRGDITIRKVGR
jgi:hypothetical protein